MTIVISVGLLGMIASVLVLLAAFAWQPWQESSSSPGGTQGGADSTPVPTRSAP